MLKYLVIAIFCIVLHFQISGQNVGINTTSPSARLHIDGTVSLITPIDVDFEDNSLLPGTNGGEQDWYVTGVDGYNSTYSAKCPLIFNIEEKAALAFDYPSPVNKVVSITFRYKFVDPNSTVGFGIKVNNNSYYPPETPNSWKQFSVSFLGSGDNDSLNFIVSANQAEANPNIVIDDIKLSYNDGHALKITDGNQAEGFILESDELGHAKWVDLRTEIDGKILNASQELYFGTTNYELEIDNGNSVKIAGLKNHNGNLLTLDGYSINATTGMSLNLPKNGTNGSSLHYNTDGTFYWGRDPQVSFTKGAYSTRWGLNNFAENVLATVWGKYNEASGENSTVWGEDNQASGLRATSWGEGNVSSALNSTTWGKLNNATENTSTAWGISNTASHAYTTAWGSNNTASGFASTVWGYNNNGIGSYTTVFGNDNTVNGSNGVAWGVNNQVDSLHSTAWGKNNVLNRPYSTVYGTNNTSEGAFNSIAGEDNIATGDHNVIFGKGCVADKDYEVVLGKFNNSYNTNLIFTIGDGTSDSNRNNLFTVSKNGEFGFNVDPSYHSFHLMDKYPSYTTRMKIEGHPGQGAYLDLKGEVSSIDLETETDTEISLYTNSNDATITLEGVNDATVSIKGEEYSILEFSSNGSKRIRYDETDNLFSILEDLYIKNGNIGIEMQNPSYDLHLGDNDAAKPGSSTWKVSSDSRLKKDVHPFTDGLTTLTKISPVWFTYNGIAGIPQETFVGTIAQELEKSAPYMVGSFQYEEEDGSHTDYKDVDYGAMDFVLINSIKEQQVLIEQQEQTIKDLQAQLLNQQATIDGILATLNKSE